VDLRGGAIATRPSLGDRAERLVVVLVEPQNAGNVGACVRAMVNMGLHRLVLVDPPCFDPERARWMAPGCDDVIANIALVATLDDALRGVHRAVATTARHRKGNQPILDPAAFAEAHWDDPEPDAVTALLFGREDFGLSREHVDRCHAVLRIPTPEHASLNLGQAVLAITNAWYLAGLARGVEATGRTVGGRRAPKATGELDRTTDDDRRADLPALMAATDDLVRVLGRVGYTRGTPPDRVQQTALGALQRAALTARHVTALRGMVRRIELVLDRPELLDEEPPA
jgi:TrmH family RNA methyltransferase